MSKLPDQVLLVVCLLMIQMFSALTNTRTLIINAANGSITTGNIFTRSTNAPDAGSVRLTSQGNLRTGILELLIQLMVILVP
jgi:hypothetical protein